MKKTKRFCLALAAMLLGIGSTWATAVSIKPVNELAFRTTGGVTASNNTTATSYQAPTNWASGFPKSETDGTNHAIECTYSAEFFTLQMYDVTDYDLNFISSLTLTFNMQNTTTYKLGAWVYPNADWTESAQKAWTGGQCPIVENFKTVVGAYPGHIAPSDNYVAQAVCSGENNSVQTFTFTGDKLKALANGAVKKGDKVYLSLIITFSEVSASFNKGRNPKPYCMKAADDKQPVMAFDYTPVVEGQPIIEASYRTNSNNNGWNDKFPKYGTANAEFESNWQARFAVGYLYAVKNFSAGNTYTLTLQRTNNTATKMYLWEYTQGIATIAGNATTFATNIAALTGQTLGTNAEYTGTPLVTAEAADTWAFAIDGSKITSTEDTWGYTPFNLILTAQPTVTSNSKIGTTSHGTAAKHPTFTVAKNPVKIGSTYYATLNAAIAAAQANDVIDILDDITVNAQIKPSVNLTINGNGHTITNGGYTAMNFIQSNTCDYTIKNVTVDGNNVSSTKNLIESGTSGKTITLQNVTIQNVSTSEGKGLLVAKSDGKLVLDTVIMKSNTAPYDLFVGNPNTVTLKNVFATDGKGIYTEQRTIVTNNLITCTPEAWESDMRISGNILPITPVMISFKAIAEHTVATYTADDHCFVLSETDRNNGWFMYQDGNDLKLTKTVANAVAQVGTQYFGSMASAVYAAPAESEITVLKNTAIYAPIVCEKKLTVNFDNKTLTNPNNDILFWWFTNAADLTVKNATIDGQSATANNYYFVSNLNGTKLTLQNITFQNIASTHNQGIISNKGGGTMNLDAVTFNNCSNTSANQGLVFIGTSSTTLSHAIAFTSCTGNAFYLEGNYRLNVDSTFITAAAIKVKFQANKRNDGALFVRGCTDPTLFTITNTEKAYPVYVGAEGLYTGKVIQNISRTPAVDYSDLATAISEANDNEEIRIYQKVVLTSTFWMEAAKTLTISGETPDIMIETKSGISTNWFIVKAGTYTFKKLTFKNKSTGKATFEFTGSANFTTVFDSVTFKDCNSGNQGVFRIKDKATVTLKNCTFDNCTSTEGYGEIFVGSSAGSLNLEGNNMLVNGIYLEGTKRVDDKLKATHTTPIPLYVKDNRTDGSIIVAQPKNLSMYTMATAGWGLGNDNKDLFAYKISDITLDETKDNSKLLSACDGQTVNVTLTRTIAASTTNYSTFCVPFETTKSELGAAEVLAYTGATISGEEATLNFEDVETLEAGKPYLVRFDAEYKNPVFNGKTITAATAGKYGDDNYEFKGLFSQTVIAETQTKEKIYLGPSNQLYWAGNNCTVGGLRGYFQAVSAPAVAARRMTIGRGTATGINQQSSISNQQSKVLRNGQLIIIRDGKMFNAQGQAL